MDIPSPWIAIILAAASYRLWRLIAEDTILNRPRRWLVNLDDDWTEGDAVPDGYRYRLAEFLTCAWCLGFWIAIAVWGLWQIEQHWTAVLATPFAVSAAVGIARARLDPPE
jgi:hypothetical protein